MTFRLAMIPCDTSIKRKKYCTSLYIHACVFNKRDFGIKWGRRFFESAGLISSFAVVHYDQLLQFLTACQYFYQLILTHYYFVHYSAAVSLFRSSATGSVYPGWTGNDKFVPLIRSKLLASLWPAKSIGSRETAGSHIWSCAARWWTKTRKINEAVDEEPKRTHYLECRLFRLLACIYVSDYSWTRFHCVCDSQQLMRLRWLREWKSSRFLCSERFPIYREWFAVVSV